MLTAAKCGWFPAFCSGDLTYIELLWKTVQRMEISKDLVAASATPLVLAILSDGESYGYAILKRVGELSGGHLQWTDGMLYPVLHRLERLGYLTAVRKDSETGRQRKYYRITSAGRAQLANHQRQWQAVDAALRGIWFTVNAARDPRLTPALENPR
jgi:PadR family transcriptional regulator PadR